MSNHSRIRKATRKKYRPKPKSSLARRLYEWWMSLDPKVMNALTSLVRDQMSLQREMYLLAHPEKRDRVLVFDMGDQDAQHNRP